MNDLEDVLSEYEAVLSWLSDIRQRSVEPQYSLVSNAQSLIAEAKAKLPRYP